MIEALEYYWDKDDVKCVENSVQRENRRAPEPERRESICPAENTRMECQKVQTTASIKTML